MKINKKGTMRVVANKIFPDRRLQLYDLGKIKSEVRKVQSPIVQFYSPVNNIGNYTPVLGIREMLGRIPDVWSCHSKVDWQFVNENYQFVIVGGAGLLHQVFAPFWKELDEYCRLPIVCWGIGACFAKSESILSNGPAPKKSVVNVFRKAELVNLRDEQTREYYGFKEAVVSYCPTAAWIHKLNLKKSYQTKQRILLVEHDDLVPDAKIQEHKDWILDAGYELAYTNNVQTRIWNVEKIIRELYGRSIAVVSTRLHGAIIGRSMGLPVGVISYDEKIEGFLEKSKSTVRIFTQKDFQLFTQKIASKNFAINNMENFESMYAFGDKVKSILAEKEI